MANTTSDISNTIEDEPQLAGPWRKASASNQGGCFELAPASDGFVALRNSRDHSQGTLWFTQRELEAFLAGAKGCEFDDLIKS